MEGTPVWLKTSPDFQKISHNISLFCLILYLPRNCKLRREVKFALYCDIYIQLNILCVLRNSVLAYFIYIND